MPKHLIADQRGPDLRLVFVVLFVAAAIMVVRSTFGLSEAPFFADTDDAMRMVVVRDFLNGQGWYDLTAHRLNTPFGAEIHWSRLVDVPLAALLALFTPLLGAQAALVVTGYVWPLLLLAVLLLLSARLAFRLVGPDGVLPALVLPILNPAITAEFTPGRVDHHSVIIILTLALAWTGIEAIKRPRFAIASGLLAATALAIATEALPSIAAAILVAGLIWVVDAKQGRTMRNFGLAFAAGSVLHLALFRPPARWLEAACDVISPVYVTLALAVALVFTLASLLPSPKAAWQRLLLLGVLGGMSLVVVVLIYPQCMGGPYGAMDPWLQAHWLAAINEAKPWAANLFEMPAYAIAVGAPALLGIAVLFWRLWRVKDERMEWAALLLFLLTAALTMLIQIRGSRLAVMPAMPIAAWLIVGARQHYLARPKLGPILGLVGSWLAFSGVVLSLLVTVSISLVSPSNQPGEVSEARASKQSCLLPSAFADLAALPPERVMAPIDLGAHLMLYTPHSVVAAPYHRNQQGVRDAFRFFNDPIAEARAMLDTRGIGLVVICPAMPEVRGLSSRTDDSFAALYAAGNLPTWLSDVSLPDSPLKVFAVLPQ